MRVTSWFQPYGSRIFLSSSDKTVPATKHKTVPPVPWDVAVPRGQVPRKTWTTATFLGACGWGQAKFCSSGVDVYWCLLVKVPMDMIHDIIQYVWRNMLHDYIYCMCKAAQPPNHQPYQIHWNYLGIFSPLFCSEGQFVAIWKFTKTGDPQDTIKLQKWLYDLELLPWLCNLHV